MLCQGDWTRIQNAFCSALAPVGHVMRKKGETQMVMVTGHSKSGFCGWSIKFRFTPDGPSFADWGIQGAKSFVVNVVENLKEWEVVELKAFPPTHTSNKGKADGIVIRAVGHKMPLLSFHCLRGFKGVDLALLRKVYRLENIEHKSKERPLTPDQFAVAIFKHDFGDEATEEMIEQALKNRNDGHSSEWNSSLFKSATALEALEEDFKDDEPMMQELEDLKERYHKFKMKEAVTKKIAEVAKASDGKASSSSAGGPMEVVDARRLVVFLPTRGMTQPEGKQYLPEGWALTKVQTRDSGWQARKVKSKVSKWKSFAEDSVSEDLLNRVWRSLLTAFGYAY